MPTKFSCDICDLDFVAEREDLRIVLEVKGDFFQHKPTVPILQTLDELSKDDLRLKLRESIKADYITKGPKFEDFFENLMKKEVNFSFAIKHPRTASGEIDYVYTHHLENPFWRISPYICIECKNWKDNITLKEMGQLGNLVAEKYPLSCIGVYITTGSYDPSAYASIKQFRALMKIILIPIERKHLTKLIENGFQDLVQEVCEYTVFRKK